MNLLETILNANGGANVQQAAQRAGLGATETKTAIENLLPAILAGVKKNTAKPEGLQGLLGALTGGSHQRFLDRPEVLTDDDTVQEGNGILGHLLGSKDVSRQVAARASERTGIETGALKKLLPVVAAMAMGAMSKGRTQAAPDDRNPLGFLGSALDSDGDGSIADDLLGFAKKLF